MKIPSIYYSLPQFLQNLACSYEGLRRKFTDYGKETNIFLYEYEQRSSWSNDRLCEYRDQRLREIVRHAYNTVPYYNKLFNEGGINPDSIKTIDDLKVIPILTKTIVNSHKDELLSTALPKGKVIIGETGGTTGDAMILRMSLQNVCEQKAVWLRYYKALGIDIDDWRVMMTHRMIMSPSKKQGDFWRTDRYGKQLFFSPFHLNESTFMAYYNKLAESKVSWIVGFPNRVMLFASMMLERGLTLNGQITHITTGAESLLGYQKEIIEKAFGVTPYQHYGMTEGVANFSEDINHAMHIDEDYSCVELIPDGNHYRIIGTSLNNYVMPLLRYDTKDTATYHVDSDGRRVIDSLDGRTEDYISLPDGRKITSIGLAFHGTLGIREMQFYQHADYSLTMYIVKGIGDFENDVNSVIDYVRGIVGEKIKFDIRYVEQIPHTKSGKKRLVISEIK